MKPDLIKRLADFASNEKLDLKITTAVVRLDRVEHSVSVRDAVEAGRLFRGCGKHDWPTGSSIPLVMRYKGGTFAPIAGANLIAGAEAAGRVWMRVRVVDAQAFYELQRAFNIQPQHFAALLAA